MSENSSDSFMRDLHVISVKYTFCHSLGVAEGPVNGEIIEMCTICIGMNLSKREFSWHTKCLQF